MTTEERRKMAKKKKREERVLRARFVVAALEIMGFKLSLSSRTSRSKVIRIMKKDSSFEYALNSYIAEVERRIASPSGGRNAATMKSSVSAWNSLESLEDDLLNSILEIHFYAGPERTFGDVKNCMKGKSIEEMKIMFDLHGKLWPAIQGSTLDALEDVMKKNSIERFSIDSFGRVVAWSVFGATYLITSSPESREPLSLRKDELFCELHDMLSKEDKEDFAIEKIIEASKTMDLGKVQSVGPWVEPSVWLKKGELEKVDLKGEEGKKSR